MMVLTAAQVQRQMAWQRACRALPVTATADEIIRLAELYLANMRAGKQ